MKLLSLPIWVTDGQLFVDHFNGSQIKQSIRNILHVKTFVFVFEIL